MSKVVKSIVVCLVILVSFSSCNNIKYRELYGITDEFVEKRAFTNVRPSDACNCRF